MPYLTYLAVCIKCEKPRVLAILFQSDVDKKSSDILKLGLLHGDMSPKKAHTGIREQPKWLEFPHKIFNDFLIAYYIAKEGGVSILGIVPNQWRIQDLPDGGGLGATTPNFGAKIYYLARFLPKTS